MLENHATVTRYTQAYSIICFYHYLFINELVGLSSFSVYLFIYLFGQRKKETNIFFEIMWSAKSLRYKIANII